jgi:hypothetical protein
MTGSGAIPNCQVPSQKFATGGAGAAIQRAGDMTSPAAAIRAAYAEIVVAVADARRDPATESFDGLVEEAVARGELDPQLGRTLRWWQRESVRGVRDHLAVALPPLFEALDTSSLRTTTNISDPPDASSGADKYQATANTPPRRTSSRTVDQPEDAITPPVQQTQARRRVLVASLVSMTGSAANARHESGEGRR